MKRNFQVYTTALVVFGLAVSFLFIGKTTLLSKDRNVDYNELTPEEKRVIIHKGTENPFSGKYEKLWDKGIYTCKRCDARLYRSDDKFDARCGWPSFDDEIEGAIRRETDADGKRTEILCNNCGAHLGHVFLGEGFTDKNTRHCVNSIAMNFVPAQEDAQTETGYFAGGCFWGVEHFFDNAAGVLSAKSGYMGGAKRSPTYREVCSETTGHAEVVQVVFDPSKTTYERMARLFFEIHDPTQVNRQGPDVGEQYRSEIFYTDETQKETAAKLIGLLRKKGYDVATAVTEARDFWEAEEYHQDYYRNTGTQPYCHSYVNRF